MPPKLLDGTPLVFCLENPKRPSTKAHDRYEQYKQAKTVAEALQLGATRSDITNDVKSGHCTLNQESKRDPDTGERPAKQQRIDSPVEVSQSQQPSGTGNGCNGESIQSSIPTETKSVQGSESQKKEKTSPLQEVDLSFAKLDGKPIKFVKRTMGEAKRLLSAEGLAEAEKCGYKFCLKDKENLSKWLVQLKDLNPDGKLAADLKKHSLDAQIDLELILPDGFPMEPPFARVVYPQLRGGYVFERGGICFEPLTQKGWVPSMTLPALAIAIKGIFDYGEVRVAGVGDKATRTVKHYTEEGARKDRLAPRGWNFYFHFGVEPKPTEAIHLGSMFGGYQSVPSQSPHDLFISAVLLLSRAAEASSHQLSS